MPSITSVTVLAAWVTLAAPAPDLTGRWSLALEPGFRGDAATVDCDVTQDGGTLTLECDDTPVTAGAIDDHAVTFVIMTGRDNLLPAKFVGTLDADEQVIAGTWRLEDTSGNRIGRFRAGKQSPVVRLAARYGFGCAISGTVRPRKPSSGC